MTLARWALGLSVACSLLVASSADGRECADTERAALIEGTAPVELAYVGSDFGAVPLTDEMGRALSTLEGISDCDGIIGRRALYWLAVGRGLTGQFDPAEEALIELARRNPSSAEQEQTSTLEEQIIYARAKERREGVASDRQEEEPVVTGSGPGAVDGSEGSTGTEAETVEGRRIRAPLDEVTFARRRSAGGGLMGAGIGAGAGGIVLVVVTGVPYLQGKQTADWPPGYTAIGWPGLQALNTVGWGLAIGGTGMMVVGAVLRARPRAGVALRSRSRSPVAEVVFRGGPTGFFIAGRF